MKSNTLSRETCYSPSHQTIINRLRIGHTEYTHKPLINKNEHRNYIQLRTCSLLNTSPDEELQRKTDAPQK